MLTFSNLLKSLRIISICLKQTCFSSITTKFPLSVFCITKLQFLALLILRQKDVAEHQHYSYGDTLKRYL